MLFVFIYSIQALFDEIQDDDGGSGDDDEYSSDMNIISYIHFSVDFAFICRDFVSACIFCGTRCYLTVICFGHDCHYI